MRTCLALLLVGLVLSFDANERWTTVSAADHSDPSTSIAAHVPDNIIVDEPLTDVVAEMLRGSHTFRNQCRRLGMTRLLRVRVSTDLKTRWSGPLECNATGTIRRYQYGRVDADVRLFTLVNAQGLIAHELEHVREYVEGINYLATSIQHPGRVWITLRGHYETARAIDAGEQVASEMSQHRRQATTTLAGRAP